MQLIPTQYKQAGHAMKLVRREGMAAMFKAVGADYWEIHQVRIRKPDVVFGKPMPEREVLASSSDFGKNAWCCTSQQRADGRFADILAVGVVEGSCEDTEPTDSGTTTETPP